MLCSKDCETEYENIDQEGKNQAMDNWVSKITGNQGFTKREK